MYLPAHDGANVDVSNTGLEGRQVVLAKILLSWIVILTVPVRLHIVDCKVLASCDF